MLKMNETEIKTTRQTRSRTAFKCIQSRFDRIRSIAIFFVPAFILDCCFVSTHTDTHTICQFYNCKTSRFTSRGKTRTRACSRKRRDWQRRQRKKPIRTLNLETFVYIRIHMQFVYYAHQIVH